MIYCALTGVVVQKLATLMLAGLAISSLACAGGAFRYIICTRTYTGSRCDTHHGSYGSGRSLRNYRG